MLDVYLMGPYTWHGKESERRAIECSRYRMITKFAAAIAHEGLTVYSPITHSHPMTEFATLPGTWDYWKRQDEAVMQVCRECWQLTFQGWESSVGCQAEIAMAGEMGKPVRYVHSMDDLQACMADYKNLYTEGK
jgi:hypothetical protein